MDWREVFRCEVFQFLRLIQLVPNFTGESLSGFLSEFYSNDIWITWIDKFFVDKELLEVPVCFFEFDGFVVNMVRSVNAFKAVCFVGDFIEEIVELIGDGFDLSEGKSTN